MAIIRITIGETMPYHFPYIMTEISIVVKQDNIEHGNSVGRDKPLKNVTIEEITESLYKIWESLPKDVQAVLPQIGDSHGKV